MSSTSSGISTSGSSLTSWRISSIGKSGARSSGPTGSPVPGCSTGCAGVGMSARTLYQRRGSCDSSSRNFVCIPTSLRGRHLGDPALGDLELAHPELLHLPRHRHRERVDDADVARDLEPRDAVAAELPELVLVERGALLHDDPRADLLAVALVRHADHLDVLDRGMRVEEFLDLARVDVLAAANDHV